MQTDASAARAMCLREGVGKTRHLDLRLLWTQQAVKHLGLETMKVPGVDNHVDLVTKKHTASEHERLRRLCSLVSLKEITAQPAVKVWRLQQTNHHVNDEARQLVLRALELLGHA